MSGNVLNRALVFSVGTTIFSLLELAVHSGYIHLRVLFVLTWFLFHAGMYSMLFMCHTASIRCARHMQLSAGIHVAGMYRLKTLDTVSLMYPNAHIYVAPYHTRSKVHKFFLDGDEMPYSPVKPDTAIII